MAAQWAPEDIPGGPFVPIGERIRALRSERGWSQDELATKISAAGAHQISRYENGKIIPATETVVRLAEVFDVSIDYLLVDEAPRRPLHIPDTGLADRLSVELADLSDTERVLGPALRGGPAGQAVAARPRRRPGQGIDVVCRHCGVEPERARRQRRAARLGHDQHPVVGGVGYGFTPRSVPA